MSRSRVLVRFALSTWKGGHVINCTGGGCPSTTITRPAMCAFYCRQNKPHEACCPHRMELFRCEHCDNTGLIFQDEIIAYSFNGSADIYPGHYVTCGCEIGQEMEEFL